MTRQLKTIISISAGLAIVASAISPLTKLDVQAEEYTVDNNWDWAFDDGGRYYSNSVTGEYLADGWVQIGDNKYYFDASGYSNDDFHDGIKSGYSIEKNEDGSEKEPVKYDWFNEGSGWWYGTEDGSDYCYATASFDGADGFNYSGVEMIDGTLYRFDTNGFLTGEGWSSYEYTSNGETITDWYYTNADGSLKTGWQQIDGEWYYFHPVEGYMYKAGGHATSLSSDATTYVFDTDGTLVSNEWVTVNLDNNGSDSRKIYYYGFSDGSAAKGWQQIGSKWYYFDDYGRNCASFYTDKKTLVDVYVDGYYLNGTGFYPSQVCSWHQNGDSWWYGTSSYYLTNRYALIDNTLYWFDSNGNMVSEYTQTNEYNNYLYWILTLNSDTE